MDLTAPSPNDDEPAGYHVPEVDEHIFAQEQAPLSGGYENGVDFSDPGSAPASPEPPGRPHQPQKRHQKHDSARLLPITVVLPDTTLITPRLKHEPFDPPAPHATESHAVRALLKHTDCQEDDEFLELELRDFVIYGSERGVSAAPVWEMRNLAEVGNRRGSSSAFLAAGVLASPGCDERFWVEDMEFGLLPISNYGQQHASTQDQIWICTRLQEQHKDARQVVYYKLVGPAREYARFWAPFYWVANLAKHFVDFVEMLAELPAGDGDVSIYHFRSRFAAFLRRTHGDAPDFARWYRAHGSADFRNSVAANFQFLWKEAVGVLGDSVRELTLWKEISSFTAIPRYPSPPPEGGRPVPRTVVTRYTYDCFKGLPFGNILAPTDYSPETARLRDAHLAKLQLEAAAPAVVRTRKVQVGPGLRVKPGDVISIKADDSEADNGCWKAGVSTEWYLLIQSVHEAPAAGGRRRLDATWLYRPWDTAIGDSARYPWPNELFLSDHCTCAEDKTRYGWIHEDEITGVHSVAFGGAPDAKAEFFCRQIYLTADEQRWVELRPKADLVCCHRTGVERPIKDGALYQPGVTVLADLGSSSDDDDDDDGGGVGPTASSRRLLEPCVLIDRADGRASLRRLLRRSVLDPGAEAAPNEVVFSEEFIERPLHSVQGRCFVRAFKAGEAIPCPYNRGGTGNLFFMTHRLTAQNELEPIVDSDAALGFRQGFDPTRPPDRAPLRGLDLFCGGGNFGRGLEEGGGIKMKWCNDYSDTAMHTYMANLDRPNAVSPFLGSIDDLQRLAMRGDYVTRKTATVPRPGEVDFISGGSPCPGFSALTTDKTTPQQRKNQSLIASFVSAVDLYRPRFGLLENVLGLVDAHTKVMARHQQRRRVVDKEDEEEDDDEVEDDVCGQMLAAMLGMGYQAQMFTLSAARYGGCQKRRRVFLTFAAPGHRLPLRPRASHPYQPGWHPNGRGMLPNGQQFLRVDVDAAALPLVTARAATADLPALYDARPNACVRFPDHRELAVPTYAARRQNTAIPCLPYGLGFADAFYGREAYGIKRGFGPALVGIERTFFETYQPHHGGRNNVAVDGDDGIVPTADFIVPDDFSKDASMPPPPPPKKPCQQQQPSLRLGRSSNAWARISPFNVFETVTTANRATDGKAGRWLHWEEPRSVTLMEARRAQGFPDDEVLLGVVAQRWRTVGNSVAREVSLALGLVFREAWVGGLYGMTGTTGTRTTMTTRERIDVDAVMDVVYIDDDDDDDLAASKGIDVDAVMEVIYVDSDNNNNNNDNNNNTPITPSETTTNNESTRAKASPATTTTTTTTTTRSDWDTPGRTRLASSRAVERVAAGVAARLGDGGVEMVRDGWELVINLG